MITRQHATCRDNYWIHIISVILLINKNAISKITWLGATHWHSKVFGCYNSLGLFFLLPTWSHCPDQVIYFGWNGQRGIIQRLLLKLSIWFKVRFEILSSESELMGLGLGLNAGHVVIISVIEAKASRARGHSGHEAPPMTYSLVLTPPL